MHSSQNIRWKGGLIQTHCLCYTWNLQICLTPNRLDSWTQCAEFFVGRQLITFRRIPRMASCFGVHSTSVKILFQMDAKDLALLLSSNVDSFLLHVFVSYLPNSYCLLKPFCFFFVYIGLGMITPKIWNSASICWWQFKHQCIFWNWHIWYWIQSPQNWLLQ